MIFIPPQNEKKFFFLTDQVYLKQQTRVMAKQHISKSRPTFNLCDFVSTCKKTGYFIDFFWKYGWLKNPAIWLDENIFAHISGNKISPNMGFVQEHNKYYKFSL